MKVSKCSEAKAPEIITYPLKYIDIIKEEGVYNEAGTNARFVVLRSAKEAFALLYYDAVHDRLEPAGNYWFSSMRCYRKIDATVCFEIKEN